MHHTVPTGFAGGLRVDAYAVAVFLEVATRAQAKKLLKKGALQLNGAPVESSRFVAAGDVLSLDRSMLPPPPTYGREIEVVHADPWVAIVNKPAGLAVSGNQPQTLWRALPHNLLPSSEPDALPWPSPVHRLDVRTQGLVVVARTAGARAALGQAFEQGRVHKRYLAILVGKLEGEGEVDSPVGGRPARSTWRALTHTPSLHVECLTTVELFPHTGRTHQLRIHMASLGHPVLGDDLHTPSDTRVLRGGGMFLAAVGLRLPHPTTGEPLEIDIPEPPKFETFRAREARRARS